MEVVTALAGAGPPVGVLHGGTANVLARTLGVPRAVDRAVPALLGGAEARLDLGRLADGRHFAIGLGVGLDAAMIAAASPTMKRRLGWAAYALGALRAGLRLERFTVRLTVDGQTIERDASAVLLANFGAVLGGTIRFGDGILHDDGLLTACVFSPRTRVEALRILWRMLRAGAPPHPRVLYASGRHFRLETSPPHRAQADGELIGETPLEVEVVAEGARVLVPLKA
jgi:diacylglycerol kinase (ATP)